MRLLRSLQPALAALLAACVLLLGLAAQAPQLHEALCQHGYDHAEHGDHGATSHSDHATDASHASDSAPDSVAPDDAPCAVTLFASGCEVPTPPLLLAEPALNGIRVAHFTEFMLARTLRGPARVCGPPSLA